jgi:hypothetical protein
VGIYLIDCFFTPAVTVMLKKINRDIHGCNASSSFIKRNRIIRKETGENIHF